MNMQTASKGSYYGENFTAVSIHQQVLKRSVVKGYFLNRENFEPLSAKIADPLSKWGRNAGLEFDFNNQSGSLKGWASAHQSFKPGVHGDDKYMEGGGTYSNPHFNATIDLLHMGTNYYTDMGYVQRISNYDAQRDTSIRVGFQQAYTDFTYKILPKKGKVGQYNIEASNFTVFNLDNTLNETDNSLNFTVLFNNTSFFTLFGSTDELNLLYPTSFTSGVPLPKGHYSYAQGGLGFNTDVRKPFSFNVRLNAGGFYNGNLQSYSGGVIWRSQPHVNLSIQAEYDKLQFPGAYGSTELFLISPKVEINFSTKVFWTTFLQYNTQQNNYNINSRFQYRYRPMSDLFLVYTDNYFTTPFLQNKNRAIVFKLNYWLNM